MTFSLPRGPVFAKGEQLAFQLLFAMWWCSTSITAYIVVFIHKLPVVGDLADLAVPFFTVLLIFLSIKYLIRVNSAYSVSLFVVIVIILLLTYALNLDLS